MNLTEDKSQLVITPDSKFAKELIDRHIKSKGTHQLNDAIKEAISFNAYSDDNLSFHFDGVYPYHFQSYQDAYLFKDGVDRLIENNVSHLGNFKRIGADDILFISYFLSGYIGDVYSYNTQLKHLDELIDVFIELHDSKPTPTASDYVWIFDGVTGIETQIDKKEFSEDELKMNGGYKVESRMIPPDNVIYHFANDRPIVIDKRLTDQSEIKLPERLSKKLHATIIDHIISEHKSADTKFYKELKSGYIDTRKWRNRTKARGYGRNNRILSKLIYELDTYLLHNNSSTLITDRRGFIYDFLALLKLIQPPLKLNRADKALEIRTIVKDNPI